jgi:biopolymer transport protein TolR
MYMPCIMARLRADSAMAFGRFSRTVPAAPMGEINMTPLIDVMLVLLVIFMVTAPFLVSAVKVTLPSAESRDDAPAPAALVVVIDKSGQVFIQDRPLDAGQLPAELARVASAAPETEIQLRADTAVPYGRVAQFMALAQAAGLARIGFVTEAATSPPLP